MAGWLVGGVGGGYGGSRLARGTCKGEGRCGPGPDGGGLASEHSTETGPGSGSEGGMEERCVSGLAAVSESPIPGLRIQGGWGVVCFRDERRVWFVGRSVGSVGRLWGVVCLQDERRARFVNRSVSSARSALGSGVFPG